MAERCPPRRSRVTQTAVERIVPVTVERVAPLTSPARADGSDAAAIRSAWIACYAALHEGLGPLGE